MLTMQGSIWPTLLHLFVFPILSQQTLNVTHSLSPNSPLYLFPTSHNNLQDIRFTLTRNPDFMLTVQVYVGTPLIDINLLMDIGSALTWTQCKPCKNCYTQKTPLYDSHDSITFRKLRCDHPLCHAPHYTCLKNECTYNIAYGEGTVVKGVASTDTFFFFTGTRAASLKAFPNVIFGCSNEIYKADSLARSSVISGIMGLNRAPTSLLTQLFPQQKRRFSYCLSPFNNRQIGNDTILRFGDDVNVPTRNPTLQTPFRSGFSNYQLDLLDISVGNRRLRIPVGTFSPKPKGGGGFIIESGSLFPQIQKNGWGGKPYTTVIEAFKQYYTKLGLQKIRTPAGMKLELCYRKPVGFSRFASMTYHFRGADYVVDGKYTSIVDERGGFFCVAVTPARGVSVLGTWPQQNMRLVFDDSMGVLRFGAEDCSRDRP